MSQAHLRRPDRIGTWILVLATVVGVWVGLTAPDVSPVEPPAVTGPR